ncbi:hypothetical protein ACFUYE_29400 [Micromonospora humida]|uniref:hypothetical protein n=1 Tax=Micromonospora humida TaxID=2809018 RepID=UPI0036731E62
MTGELPADLGPCRWCGDPQWRHRRGRGGCQEVGCGCAKYGQDPAAEQAEQERVLTVFAEVCERQADQARAELAELTGVVESDPASPVPGVVDERPDGADPGVPVAGFEPAQPDDVDLPPAPEPDARPPMPPADFLTAHTMVGERAAAGAGWQEGYLAGQAAAAGPDPALAQAVAVAEALAAERDAARRECDRLAGRLDIIRKERRREHLAHQVATLTAERDRALAQRDQAYERVDELHHALGRIYAALGLVDLDDTDQAVQAIEALTAAGQRAAGLAEDAERRVQALADELDTERATVGPLRTELGRAHARAQRLKGQLDEAVTSGVAAASRVLWRYDASQCLAEGCGVRYTVPAAEHEHPLVPVTVLVVRREVVPGA